MHDDRVRHCPSRREPKTVPPFAVISGAQVQQALQGREKQVVELVEPTYRLHAAGDSVNPPSYFLRFPDRPTSRIIALPASVGGQRRVDGIKWVSSFPDNVAAGIPRASAVLILNDHATGYPFAVHGELHHQRLQHRRLGRRWPRTGSAATRPRPTRIGFFGVGLIARYIHTFLAATDWSFDEIGLYDLSADSAEGFKGYLERSGAPTPGSPCTTAPKQLIRSSDLIVFATVAGQPHVHDPAWFAHNPLVLHVSLRDLAPEILLAPPTSSTTSTTASKPTPPPTWRSRSPATGTSWTAPWTTSWPAGSRCPPTAPWCSPRSGWACSTWPSASTSTTRSPEPANCTPSTVSSTTSAGTAEVVTVATGSAGRVAVRAAGAGSRRKSR